jgi:hypothetical protein
MRPTAGLAQALLKPSRATPKALRVEQTKRPLRNGSIQGVIKMNRIKGAISLFAFSLVLLGVPAVASAQWGGNNDPYYGGGRYNIRGTVESLRNRARNFARNVDRVDDRRDRRDDDRWGGGYDRFDNLDRLAQQFEDAANDLRNAYGRGRNMNNSSDEARRVLQLGSEIDRVIGNRRGNRRGNNNRVFGEWNQIRSDLRIIADAYGYRQNNGGGNWRNRLPFPLPF